MTPTRKALVAALIVFVTTSTTATAASGPAAGDAGGWGPAVDITPPRLGAGGVDVVMSKRGTAVAVWATGLGRRRHVVMAQLTDGSWSRPTAAVGSGPNPRGHDTHWNAGISADGRYVAFVSSAKNLIPERTDGSNQVFVRDRVLGITRSVSLTAAGERLPGGSGVAELSADGRYVTFVSDEEGIVPEDRDYMSDIFVRD